MWWCADTPASAARPARARAVRPCALWRVGDGALSAACVDSRECGGYLRVYT